MKRKLANYLGFLASHANTIEGVDIFSTPTRLLARSLQRGGAGPLFISGTPWREGVGHAPTFCGWRVPLPRTPGWAP